VLTVHPSCVQIAVSAVKLLCPVRVTRNDRPDAFTSAALPAADSGEPASTFNVSVLFVIVPLMVGRLLDEPPPPLGDVGLLPPHPVIAIATAPSEAV
jgi:hypothetical protein